MPNIQKIAFWIKENSHLLRVIGGVLFLCALITGVVWSLGYDVEPIAYVFGLLSSSFLASPSVAEYILPKIKPVKEMTSDEILHFITHSDPKKDWESVSYGWFCDVFLTDDPRLRFKAKLAEEGIQNENFIASWANCFPDKKATGYWHDLYYDGNLIKRFILVSVDGARASLPTPGINDKKVKLINYRVAQIHDDSGMLDEYMAISGLKVEKNT